MQNKLTVVNMVLNELGKQAVALLGETDDAVFIENRIDQLLGIVLAKGSWVWSLKYRSDSTPLPEAITPDFNYTYQLPADYGRLYNVRNKVGYVIIDGTISSNSSPFQYYYNTNAAPFVEGDYTPMTPQFLDALAFFIAARVCIVLTENEQLYQYLLAQYKDAIQNALQLNFFELESFGAPYNDYDRLVLI